MCVRARASASSSISSQAMGELVVMWQHWFIRLWRWWWWCEIAMEKKIVNLQRPPTTKSKKTVKRRAICLTNSFPEANRGQRFFFDGQLDLLLGETIGYFVTFSWRQSQVQVFSDCEGSEDLWWFRLFPEELRLFSREFFFVFLHVFSKGNQSVKCSLVFWQGQFRPLCSECSVLHESSSLCKTDKTIVPQMFTETTNYPLMKIQVKRISPMPRQW